MNKPTTFLNWTDGSPTKVTQPPGAQSLAGWTPGEAPPMQYMNWLFYQTDQWLKWLEENISAASSIFETVTQCRLIKGGNWSWNLTTGSFAWSSSFNIAVPSIADADNQAAAGSVTLNDGQVAYVQANIPYTLVGNTTNSSNVLTNVQNAVNLTTGMTVTGSGIPVSTTITALTDNGDGTFNVTISNNATATATGVNLTFASTGALTVSVSDNTALVPGPTTLIIARRVGNVVFVGVNTSQMVLRNQESKPLNENGYLVTASFIAGENVAYGNIVYVSQGDPTDPTRVAGEIYKVDAGGANNGVRNGFVGFVIVAATLGNTAWVVTSGEIVTSGLTPGLVYYADPTTPGNITATKPTTSGQWVVPVGIAMSTTLLNINSANSAVNSIVTTTNVYPNSFCANETDLSNAITTATSNGGGVICLLNSFTISAAHTIPANTVLIGRKGGSIITLASSGALTLSQKCKLIDVYIKTSLTSGSLVTLTGSNCEITGCNFTVPSNSTGNCLDVFSAGNDIHDNMFNGVVVPSTGTGINYELGSMDNTDEYNVFAS